MAGKPQPTTEPNFWAKVQKSAASDGCWIWHGRIDKDGYGRAWSRRARKDKPAHRVAYEYLIGEIPAGLVGDHMCSNRRCVNPGHVRLCSPGQNTMAPWSRAPSLANARKTHCDNGHEFTAENTYTCANGWRQCNTCKMNRKHARIRKRFGREPYVVNSQKTHCIRGHALAGDNLCIRADGGRACIACRSIRLMARRNRLDALLVALERLP